MVKEFSQKMIKNIEDLQLPCLEKMLSSRFGYITSGKFICEKCNNFIGKNLLALSVHKRTCDKTNIPASQEINTPSIVSPINIMLQSSAQPTTQPSQQQLPNPQPSLPTPPAQKIMKTVTKTVVQSPPSAAK